MTDLIYTRRIPGLVWLRAGVGLSGGLESSIRPVWLYGCVRRWAVGVRGRGVYVLWMVKSEGRCSVRWRDDHDRLVPCRKKAIAEEPFVDRGCPDSPDAEPREMVLRYCEVHKP